MFVLKIEIVLSALTTIVMLFFTTPVADYFFSPQNHFSFSLRFSVLFPAF